MTEKAKLYCFVDETGQDTKGDFFLVVVFLHETNSLGNLEDILEKLEQKTGKRKSKWKKTSNVVKNEYLTSLLAIKDLKRSIYYSVYKGTLEFSKLTSLTIAKAVLSQATKHYEVTIVIDGLNDREREVVTRELKGLKIKYRKIRGMKDEQSVFLRLADAMAGFLRDIREKQTYTMKLGDYFVKKMIVREI